jgi:hypothetical protein
MSYRVGDCKQLSVARRWVMYAAALQKPVWLTFLVDLLDILALVVAPACMAFQAA